MSREKVMVFNESVILPHLADFKPGIVTDEYMVSSLSRDIFESNPFYMDREEAETNPKFKQIIPYCVLKCGREIFVYERSKKGGENRLHNKWSIGVGGHLNVEDGEVGEKAYIAGLGRELEEEVGLKSDFLIIHKDAMIYDESNDVGKVHFGFVHVLEVDKNDVLSEDPSIKNHVWADIVKVTEMKNENRFENWSSIILNNMRILP